MRNKLFYKVVGIGVAAVLALGTAACGSRPQTNEEETKQDKENEKASDKSDDTVTRTGSLLGNSDKPKDEDGAGSLEEKAAEFKPIQQSFSDENEILKYLEGEWSYIFPKTGQIYATLIIQDDGSVTLVREYDGTSCKGRLSFKKGNSKAQGPDEFSLELEKIDRFLPEYKADMTGLNAISSGDFYIGTGKGEDYLYLAEIGNGDTWISMYVLNPSYNPEMMSVQTQWLFTRKNDTIDELAPITNEKFYGFAWQSESNGLYLQSMNPLETDGYEDYSDRHFLAAKYRMADDVGVRFYQYGTNLDFSGLLQEDRLNEDFPFDVYSVETDENGSIVSLSEVDSSLYGFYDLKDLEPEFSVEDNGRVFKYNNSTFKLDEFSSAATAIMDCIRVGNWIILDCHVNPHIGQYLFFNTVSGWVELTIDGANLIWKGDDLSTAVYSKFDQVYDIWGNFIGSVPEGEVYNLKYDGDYIEAEYEVVEGTSNKEFVERFEFETVDREMFSYFEYLVAGRNREWNSFLDDAPDGAAAFIMVNPPSCISNHIPYIRTYEEGALDTVAIVSMQEQEKIHLGNMGMLNYDEKSAFFATGKADLNAFTVTVPEGMPINTLVVRTKTGREDLAWDVATISGRTPQRSFFLTSDTTDDKLEQADASEIDRDEAIPYSYRSHPYNYVDGDTKFALGNYYTIELNDIVYKKFPKLVRVLNRFGEQHEAYLLGFFSDSQSEIREMFNDGWGLSYESDQSFIPVRADGRVFSFAVSDYTYLAGAHGSGTFVGYNFDSVTAKEISFADVVKKQDDLPKIIVNELEEQNPDLLDYFKNCPGDRQNLLNDIPRRLQDNAKNLQWTLDYDGINVYFEDYAMGAYAVGMQIVKVKFEDYPEIFTDTYNNYSKSSLPAINRIATEAKDAPITNIVAVNPEDLWD